YILWGGLPCHLTFCPTLSDTYLPAEMQGPGGGSYFYVRGEEQGEIQGIRIFVGMMGLIKGIQLKFGEHWSPRYGAPGGRAQEFLLWSGERITAVAGSARACIRHLRWSTSRGRQATFGRPAGARFSAHPPAAGQQLLSANGQHGLFCLSGIGFNQRCPISDYPCCHTRRYGEAWSLLAATRKVGASERGQESP
uniref:Jacalin-type lectin domain-containing protein n=1 Tax=Rhinolophus ferrumequinum TaxID=59479 RepID=A0A671F4Q5_RHIFE